MKKFENKQKIREIETFFIFLPGQIFIFSKVNQCKLKQIYLFQNIFGRIFVRNFVIFHLKI